MLLFSLGLDLFSAGLILVPLYLVLNRMYIHNLTKAAGLCIFSFYLVAVYHLVGLPCITYINPGLNLNLIPFRDMRGGLRASLLNVALFIPLGLLLPLIWSHFRILKNTVLFSFGMTLAIELLQILVSRATDVNDLICNTLGAVLGFFLWKLLPSSLDRLGCFEDHRDIYVLCIIVLMVMFFVDPFLFTFFWNLILYGYGMQVPS